MKNKTIILLVFILFHLLVGVACACGRFPISGEKSERTEEPVIITTPEIVIVEEPAEEVPVIEEAELEAVAEPEDETAESDEILVMYNDTWGAGEDMVYVGFILKNQDQDLILTDVKYYISIQDAAGKELSWDSRTIAYLFPQQTVGIFFQSVLAYEVPLVKTVDITYTYGGADASYGYQNPFSIEKIKYWEDDTPPIATGIMNNTDAKTYTLVRAYILCYDESGTIVGGGTAFLDFIPAQDQMGFFAYLDTYGPVASIEAYPVLFSDFNAFEVTDALKKSISLLEANFYTSDFDQRYGGAIIHSNLDDLILTKGIMAVVLFDDEGNVTNVGGHSFAYLFPGSHLGLSQYLYRTPKGAILSDYKIYLFPVETVEDYELNENVFQVNSAALTGDNAEKVLVNFTNTYTKQVSQVIVYVLLYDSDGFILGGGAEYYSGPIAAGGTVEDELRVEYDTKYTVARIEAWVLPSNSTVFE